MHAFDTEIEPIDVVEGHWVFAPEGYATVYHDAERLPGEGRPPKLRINFKGETAAGLRFDIQTRRGDDQTQPGPNECNRTLEEVTQRAAELGIDGDDVRARLISEFGGGIFA